MGLLEGDTALITGAASGIGQGIAKALVAEGVRPVLAMSPLKLVEPWRAK